MRRGTTPTHVFTVDDASLENIAELYITYAQGKQIVLEKTLDDVVIDTENNTISVTLTQEDTLKFKTSQWSYLYPNDNKKDMMVEIQIRMKYDDLNHSAFASNIVLIDVEKLLKNGVI